jgi:RNA polymerase sigma-70 factor, ECF subfamily
MDTINNILVTGYEQWKQKLYPYIFGLVKNKAAAEDLLQEVFIKAIEKRSSLKNAERLEAWLFAISRNTVFNYLRSNKPSCQCHCTKEQVTEPTEKKNYNEELLECLPRFINKIPQDYRQALTMADIELLPQKQIAEQLNISLTAAKSRVQRGRKKLKEVLEAGCFMEFDVYGNLVTCVPYKKRGS